MRASACFNARGVMNFGNNVTLLCNAQNIENQCDVTISHDGCTRKDCNTLKLLAEWLNNNFLRVGDFVDHESELPVICLKNNNVESILLRAFENFDSSMLPGRAHCLSKQVGANYHEAGKQSTVKHFNLLGHLFAPAEQVPARPEESRNALPYR